MTRHKLTKARTAEEAFAYATEHVMPAMNILDPLFAKDPIRTIACFTMGIAGWSIMFDNAMKFEALEHEAKCEAQSGCSL